MSDDSELEARLRSAADLIDPVPDRSRHLAEQAFTLRTLGAELAELVFDSVVDTEALVRGGGQPRLLTFQADALGIEVEVVAADRVRRIIGQVIPPETMEVEVRSGDRVVTVRADALGRFVAEGVTAGPFSLVCRFPEGDRPPVVTDWITVSER
jgi:hypothetical protein